MRVFFSLAMIAIYFTSLLLPNELRLIPHAMLGFYVVFAAGYIIKEEIDDL
jgi:hypothetical protein